MTGAVAADQLLSSKIISCGGAVGCLIENVRGFFTAQVRAMIDAFEVELQPSKNHWRMQLADAELRIQEAKSINFTTNLRLDSLMGKSLPQVVDSPQLMEALESLDSQKNEKVMAALDRNNPVRICDFVKPIMDGIPQRSLYVQKLYPFS